MWVMAGAVFFVRGLAAFQAELTDVGIGYMVLTAVFPPGTAIAGWWMGRGLERLEKPEGERHDAAGGKALGPHLPDDSHHKSPQPWLGYFS